MGGKALKNTKTRRYKKLELKVVEKEISRWLSNVLPNNEFQATKTYQEKESFGDLDIVLTNDNNAKEVLLKKIKNLSNCNEYLANGNFISFAWNDLQVDLILCEKQYFNSTLGYLNFSDVGHLVGRISGFLGFNLSMKGLEYKYKGNFICLTSNWEEALDFLGYDKNKQIVECDTLIDIFDFIYSGDYFLKEIFTSEYGNRNKRQTAKNRPNFQLFVDYLTDKKSKVLFTERKQIVSDIYLKAIEKFPHMVSEIEEIEEKILENDCLKQKFNGNIISSLTNLNGIELGKFIKHFKLTYSKKEILEKSDDELKKCILKECRLLNRVNLKK